MERGLGSPEVLTQALSDVDPGVRLAAGRGLATREALGALLGDRSRVVRVGAATALVERFEAWPEPLERRLVEVAGEALVVARHARAAARILVAVGTPVAAGVLSRAAGAGPSQVVARRALTELPVPGSTLRRWAGCRWEWSAPARWPEADVDRSGELGMSDPES